MTQLLSTSACAESNSACDEPGETKAPDNQRVAPSSAYCPVSYLEEELQKVVVLGYN